MTETPNNEAENEAALEPTPTDDGPPSTDELIDEDQIRARQRRSRWRMLRNVTVIVALCIAGYYAWPWLIPAYVYEGPLVGNAGEQEVTIAWYLSRPTGGALSLRLGTSDDAMPVEVDDRRCSVRLTGLTAGSEYDYTILLGDRELGTWRLRTNKPAGVPFHFTILGDSGRGSQAQYRLGSRMAALDPDFVLHTGDVVYGGGERWNYRERFFLPYEELVAKVCFWPSLGNHDVHKPSFGEPYLEIFTLPENGPAGVPAERNYWFDYGSARIAIVDSNLEEKVLRDDVAPWLADVLADESPTWKFVVFHHPPYTGGKYQPNETMQKWLVPVIERTGVDVVFNGHDHNYQRIGPLVGGQMTGEDQGVTYIITGAGGARLYQPKSDAERPDYVRVINDTIHSVTHVRVNGDELRGEQIDVNGNVLDEWSLRKH